MHLAGPAVKRRKRHRRKNLHSQEVSMRGVYFKNMKWQAAIKVDKKQIHLGTVGSQEEAAHLYDRYYLDFYNVITNSFRFDNHGESMHSFQCQVTYFCPRRLNSVV